MSNVDFMLTLVTIFAIVMLGIVLSLDKTGKAQKLVH
jgi:hypothetical protein